MVNHKWQRNQESVSIITQIVRYSTHNWIGEIVHKVDGFLLCLIKPKNLRGILVTTLLFWVSFRGTDLTYVFPVRGRNTIYISFYEFVKIEEYFFRGTVADMGQIGCKDVEEADDICGIPGIILTFRYQIFIIPFERWHFFFQCPVVGSVLFFLIS